jgi:hypothetical protein
MVFNPSGTYPPAYHSACADGKPHKVAKVKMPAAFAVGSPKPLLLVVHSAVTQGTVDLALKEDPYNRNSKGWIGVLDIPKDYPGRTSFDKASVWTVAYDNIPCLRCEVDREYYHTTATDMTAYDEGQILVCAADGDLAKADDDTGDAITINCFAFEFVYAVSTTEIVVRYKGFMGVDTA